jgi:hypothetical protein
MSNHFLERMKEWQTRHDEIWENMSDEQKLAAADVIFRAIDTHAREGGSFRYLIYNRLGFKVGGAYAVLQCAGALAVSNLYVIEGGE